MMDADNERPARSQTFQLRGKVPYVVVGDRFVAEASIIAGVPPKRASLGTYLQNKYDPFSQIAAQDAVDRYAAVKALPYLPQQKQRAVAAIEQRLDGENEHRVLLEAAGAGTALGSAKAWEQLEGFVWKQERADMRMEAVFILSELRSPGAGKALMRIATDPQFADDEIRQAAVWGLGKAGLKSYADLVQFLNDADRDLVLHAVAGFGPDTPEDVIVRLVAELVEGDPQRAPAASEALRIIGNDAVLKNLVAVAREKEVKSDWVLATLGRLPAAKVRTFLQGDPLLARLAPMLLLSDPSNWITDDAVDIDLKFLLKQNLY
jgi:hypothetical protein